MPRGRRSSGALVSEMASTSSRTGAAGVGGESLTGPPGWAHPTVRRLLSRGSRAASRTRIGRGAPAQRRGQRAVLIAATTGHPSGVARADGAWHGVRRQGRTAHHARQAVGRRPGAVGRRPRIRCACPRGEAGADPVAAARGCGFQSRDPPRLPAIAASRHRVGTTPRHPHGDQGGSGLDRAELHPTGSRMPWKRGTAASRRPSGSRPCGMSASGSRVRHPSRVSVASSAITCTPSSHCGNRCEAIASERSGR